MENEIKRTVEIEKGKLRTQILSSVSHDLKTPLATIIGSLNILTSTDINITEEQKADLLETALSEAHRLNNFITNILTMARIESGAIKVKLEWYLVDDLIKHIKRSFEIKYPNRSLVVNKFDVHITAKIDAILFEQIMMSILDNATKYSPIDIEVELSVEENFCLNFLVRDYGKGVPENMLEKIFDKYSRLQIGDMQAAGTGLGLAISKALVELQNMSIKAYNHKEGGLVIKISCPEWRA